MSNVSRDYQERIQEMIAKQGIPTGPGPERDVWQRSYVLQMVKNAWAQHPEYRLGQLLSNAMGTGPQDLFYVEDEQLIAALVSSSEAGS